MSIKNTLSLRGSLYLECVAFSNALTDRFSCAIFACSTEREFFIDNLLVEIHGTNEMT